MNRLFATIIVTLVLLVGCSQEEEILPKQRENSISFLTRNHEPKLISERQISQEGQLPYYSTHGDAVYRYIVDVWNPDREDRKQVMRNSMVTITYRAYIFNYTSIPVMLSATSLPFDSNDTEIEQDMYTEWGLSKGAWRFEPMVIRLGRDKIIKGLELALVGCREGDRVEAYMTYNMAYGTKNFGTVPRESPVAYIFTVDKVE